MKLCWESKCILSCFLGLSCLPFAVVCFRMLQFFHQVLSCIYSRLMIIRIAKSNDFPLIIVLYLPLFVLVWSTLFFDIVDHSLSPAFLSLAVSRLHKLTIGSILVTICFKSDYPLAIVIKIINNVGSPAFQSFRIITQITTFWWFHRQRSIGVYWFMILLLLLGYRLDSIRF
jgi:hypothetical protein